MSEFPDSPTIAEEWARACRTVVVQGAGARPVKVVGRDGSVIREATTVEVFTKLAEAAQIATVLRDGVVPHEIVEAANARRAAGLADQCWGCGRDLAMSARAMRRRGEDPRLWKCSLDGLRKTSPEKRREGARKRFARMTPEQRSSLFIGVTREHRSDAARKANLTRTNEERRKTALEFHHKRTPEQRSAAIVKGHATRKERKAGRRV